MRTLWLAIMASALAAPPTSAPPNLPSPVEPIPANRAFDVLEPVPDARMMFAQAGEQLGDWVITVAGVPIDGAALLRIADTPDDEPILRALREELRRPFDLEDFVYFLDDVLAAGETRRGEPFDVGSGRARALGILVHPDDIFRKTRARVYPHRTTEVAVDRPPPQDAFPRAEDGEQLGPNWTMRFRSPTDPHEMYRTLAKKRPEATFASRVAALVTQIQMQGGETHLTSFLRYRERGYLMWGAHELRSCKAAACVKGTVARLEAAKSWASVDIQWNHPDGWAATREAARQMADAFDVVYATERGARTSKHYDGEAADFVAAGLPRTLELWAPDGAHRVFDLSAAGHPRDLSLSPELIEWVETHFQMTKLRSDYPHWSDAS